MNKKLALINILATIVLQIVTVVNGLIVPRIVLSFFGSEVNGLVASISQFLGYIQLLEGGVSGVIMAALYKGLSSNDDKKVSGIINATTRFFRKIGAIYLIYSLLVGIVYPLLSNSSFSFVYVFSLSIILALSTFVQYFFSLTYRTLIIADRRAYIVSISQIVFVIINFGFVVLSVKIWPEIHFLKSLSVIAFLIQPIVYGVYVKKHYKLDKKIKPDDDAIKQRWDGFGQNLAFFIHSNTDVVVLTIFASLPIVSVYSVYTMVTGALVGFVLAISGAIKPSFGHVLAGGSLKHSNEVFDYYELAMSGITSFAFSCCAGLITPFVLVYTKGVTDADYNQLVFGIVISIAEGIYCLRDPYVGTAYASGHFKQTANFSYIEAVANITVSIVLVKLLGLLGVAIGTLVAMTYRYIAHVRYLKDHILFRNLNRGLRPLGLFVGSCAVAIIVSLFVPIHPTSFFEWVILALIVAGASAAFEAVFVFAFWRKTFKDAIKNYFSRKQLRKNAR